jgi:hypothetical protein
MHFLHIHRFQMFLEVVWLPQQDVSFDLVSAIQISNWKPQSQPDEVNIMYIATPSPLFLKESIYSIVEIKTLHSLSTI